MAVVEAGEEIERGNPPSNYYGSKVEFELWSCVATVSKDMSQPRPTFENGFQDTRRTVSVLNARNGSPGQPSNRVCQQRCGACDR